MQKVINVLAVLSFLGTASIVGAGAYVYINKDSLIEQAKEAATKAATEAVAGALPGMLDGMMPEMPELPGATQPCIAFLIMFSSNKPAEQMTEKAPKKSPLKAVAIAAGSLFALAHVGLLGYVLSLNARVQEPPVINIPRGDYSSYRIKANKDGYEIEYRANDPKVLESEKSLDLDQKKKGWFGGTDEKRIEYRRDQFTMDGTRNIGGEIQRKRESQVQKAQSVSRRTLEHGLKVQWQVVLLLLSLLPLLYLLSLMLDGWQVDGHYS